MFPPRVARFLICFEAKIFSISLKTGSLLLNSVLIDSIVMPAPIINSLSVSENFFKESIADKSIIVSSNSNFLVCFKAMSVEPEITIASGLSSNICKASSASVG